MTNKQNIWILSLLTLALAGAALAEDMPTGAPNQQFTLERLSMPSDVGIGEDGQIYVVDGGNHQIAVFDTAGTRVTSLGLPGSEDGQLTSPLGLGIGAKGDIYVADKGNNRIVMYDANGRPRRTFALEVEGEDVVPVDVAISRNGKELFITANESHRVVVFSNKGQFLRAWGGEGEEDGQFRFPATIDIDAVGNLYVVDVLNARVQKFDAAGNHLLTIGELGGKTGTFFRPKGVAVDSSGNIYVSDSYLGVIQVFDAAGEFLYVLGEEGTATVFDTPVGMAAIGKRLFVTQMLPGNVLVLEPQVPLPANALEEVQE